jgi:hypothetical protein
MLAASGILGHQFYPGISTLARAGYSSKHGNGQVGLLSAHAQAGAGVSLDVRGCRHRAAGNLLFLLTLRLLLYQSTAFARSFIYPAALHGRRALAGLSRGTTNPDSIFMAWLPSAGPLMRDFIYGN